MAAIISSQSVAQDYDAFTTSTDGGTQARAYAQTDGESNLLAVTALGNGTFVPGTAFAAITYIGEVATTNNASPGTTFFTGGYKALAVDIDITAASSSSIVFTLSRLGADGVWYPIWTSGSLASTGKVSASIGRGLTGGTVTAGVGQGAGAFPAALTTQGGLSWTLTGTSVTFNASIVGMAF